MEKITVTAPAKVNLCIDVLGKDPSGYHQIQTVLCICENHADEITIFDKKENDNTSIVNPGQNQLIKMEENLAFRALKLLKETYGIKRNADIQITKNIPISAGLGGGSSDAAATLKALNKLWDLKLNTEQLLALAEKLGMDVPFFILGGTALGTNYGEKVEPLPHINDLKFEIKIPQNPSPVMENATPHKATTKTANMYAALDLTKCGKNTEKTQKLIQAIKENDQENILKNLHNDFETINPTPQNWHLTGSGPAIFTIL